MEYAALIREMCVAFRLLEDFGGLKPGDSVILNASNGAIGSVVVQLCRMLKLRAIAVVRPSPDFDKIAAELKTFGAVEVLPDSGSLKARLDENKFFSKPRLALDAVGGSSASRIAECLQEVRFAPRAPNL